MSDTVTLTAPAKVNLFLNILGQRPDGYHDIRTVFLPVNPPGDTVTVTRVATGGLTVECDDPRAPGGASNLGWRAAEAYAQAAGVRPNWRIEIRKRIPVAAGLGGGSADAAAVLRALNMLGHGPDCDPASAGGKEVCLDELGAGLGADVPFFIRPCPSLGTGRGDRLQPLECRVKGVAVLVNPGFPSPVRWPYTHWCDLPAPAAPAIEPLIEAMAAGDLLTCAMNLHNALEHAIVRKFPLVEMLLDFLRGFGALGVLVSGSGPTVFGLFPPGFDATPLADEAHSRFGKRLWVCATPVGGN